MNERDAWIEKIEKVTQEWRQGDVSRYAELEFLHLAKMSCPITASSEEAILENGSSIESDYLPIAERIDGIVVLTQTCDIVRSWQDRPYIEISPLVKVDDDFVEQVRPAY
ncbi:MAG: hypothetical protein F4X92_06050 [Gammaproteobacteria bacterium]|nr:hypothetical protein [Gammaproteobacteria bacterium]